MSRPLEELIEALRAKYCGSMGFYSETSRCILKPGHDGDHKYGKPPARPTALELEAADALAALSAWKRAREWLAPPAQMEQLADELPVISLRIYDGDEPRKVQQCLEDSANALRTAAADVARLNILEATGWAIGRDHSGKWQVFGGAHHECFCESARAAIDAAALSELDSRVFHAKVPPDGET